jgi:anti-sigma regulatory factor (Ser/Thr protein kinase)
VTTIHPIHTQRPADARRIVRSRLEGMTPKVIGTVELLTSELVNNAIVHGDGVAALVLEVNHGIVHVEVHDTNPTVRLDPLQFEPFSVRGRGLAIVNALASAWGVDPRSDGKAVWFELNT